MGPSCDANKLLCPRRLFLEAQVAELRSALEAMHEEFASNFPDDERGAVDMARAALETSK